MTALDTCSIDEILRTRKSLRRELSAATELQPLRIAVLGGSTTEEVVRLVELLLLANGFRPTFLQSEYGRFYEEAVHDPTALINFKPDLVYVHTSCLNVQQAPPTNCSETDLAKYVEAELARYREMWDALDENVGCQVIQNNFEAPPYAHLGNLDAAASGGSSRFLMQLNVAFAQAAMTRPRLMLQDVHGLSARLGLQQWFDWSRYFSYKILHTPEANLELARSLSSMVRAVYGKSRKVLVLDLDNTLWGGVIGDDGVENIQIGHETPLAEAYTAFQRYCLALRDRGVLLAVCSKNDEAVARSGFEHPSSTLKIDHISCVKANWEPKHENILAIARELNLGLDSIVFVDDNPAEREIVEAQLPEVAVPNVGDDVTRFMEILEKGRYFEPASLSGEDVKRASLYADNAQRGALQAKFTDYEEYLDSLEMVAEIDLFRPVYLERIAQLTNKTNQFNLTTRRYTLAELSTISNHEGYLGLYGKLKDRFGENGLVSVVLGRKDSRTLHLDLWLMSCRVLKRDLELAMLDAVADRAVASGIEVLQGYYVPTRKNGMVADFYLRLGFSPSALAAPSSFEDGTVWSLIFPVTRRRTNTSE